MMYHVGRIAFPKLAVGFALGIKAQRRAKKKRKRFVNRKPKACFKLVNHFGGYKIGLCVQKKRKAVEQYSVGVFNLIKCQLSNPRKAFFFGEELS